MYQKTKNNNQYIEAHIKILEEQSAKELKSLWYDFTKEFESIRKENEFITGDGRPADLKTAIDLIKKEEIKSKLHKIRINIRNKYTHFDEDLPNESDIEKISEISKILKESIDFIKDNKKTINKEIQKSIKEFNEKEKEK